MSKFLNVIEKRKPTTIGRDRFKESKSLPLSYDFSFLNYWDAEHLRKNLKLLRLGVYSDYVEQSLPFAGDETVREMVERVSVLVFSDISVDDTFRNMVELHAWQTLGRKLDTGLTDEWDVLHLGWLVVTASEGMFFGDLKVSGMSPF